MLGCRTLRGCGEPAMSRLVTLLVAVVGFGMTGCDTGDRPVLGEVRGLITLDGKPLPDAKIRFLPMEAVRGSMGVSGADGRYEMIYLRDLMGVAVGQHRVQVMSASETRGEILPQKYTSGNTLTAQVKAGMNEINFDLTSDKAAR